jgi:alpha-L-fucosidase
MKRKSILGKLLRAALALVLTASFVVRAAAPDSARAEWFRDAKFGMFIHWGLYAQVGGIWKGQKYFGIGEWLMNRAQIPAAEYATLAGQFNPTNFDAQQWVALAKTAGMKYIVITAKHHDGFAMFKSDASPFNIVDATPFKRDPLAELAEECRKQDLKLCFYYSQWQDWHEPNGAGNTWESTNSAAHFSDYFESKCKPQVKELLAHYGPLGLIWFDTPGAMTREQSTELLQLVRTLQPGCLVSSRVGNGVGDFTDLGDHEMPSVVPDGPWESLFTHNDSWGFVPYDKNWRSSRELVHMLIKINAKGGNFLLNVGPQCDGRMPDRSIKVLQRLGQWTHSNAEAIYGTSASPFPPLAWGECTVKPGVFYFHILDWPVDGRLRIPGLKGDIRHVALLNSKKELSWKRDGADVLVSLPAGVPDDLATVVKLEHKEVSVDPVRALFSGSANVFEPVAAKLNGKAVMKKQSWMQEFGNWKHQQRIEDWAQPTDAAEWSLRVVTPGDYRVTLTYSRSGKSGRQGRIEFAGQTLLFEAQNTGTEPRHEFTHVVGVVKVSEAGQQALRVAPADAGDELFKLKQVTVESFE